jgi:hypothetical protein
VLLVPSTEYLLTSRDRETGVLYADLVNSEEFLASHVLRIPAGTSATPNGKKLPETVQVRGKAKQFTTLNGRSVIVKDSFVYGNKGMYRLGYVQTDVV